MKKLLAAVVGCAALIGGGGATGQTIERYSAPPPAPPAMILQGVKVPAGSELFFLSGQLASPADPSKAGPAMTMADVGDTRTQTISTLTKIKGLLAAHGYAMSDIIKMTVFVAADPKLGKMDFAGMNDGFKQFFKTADNPNTVARSAFQVAALAGPAFLVEIEVIAAKAPAR